MTPTEAAALLTCAAAFDNRKPDADAATAWAIALDGLDFIDCREAIVTHYQGSKDWLMVADVIAAVKRKRGSRITAAPPLAVPPGFDPDDTAAYQALLRAQREAAATGETTADAVAEIEGPRRPMPDVTNLLRKVEPMKVKPDKRHDPEYRRRLAQARAELDAKRDSDGAA